MEESPFPYQGPLEPAQVHGRDDLIAGLIERVTGRRVTALLGPRRYGKTSVLRRVADDLTEVSTVWVDLYEVTSPADVAVRFDDGLAAARGPIAEVASRVALTLSLNLGLLKVALSGPARNRPDPSAVLSSLLAVLVKAALATPTLLVVDEFSSVSRGGGRGGCLAHRLTAALSRTGAHLRRVAAVDDADSVFGPAPAVLRAG